MKKIFFILISTAFLLSCKKQTDKKICTPAACKKEFKEGTIYWGGEVNVDGIGWYLKTSDKETYVFDNLPEKYKIDKLSISVCAYKTDKQYYCLCSEPKYKYHIECIQEHGLNK